MEICRSNRSGVCIYVCWFLRQYRCRQHTNVHAFCVTRLLRICCGVWRLTSKSACSFRTKTSRCCSVDWPTISGRSTRNTSTQRNATWFSVETTWYDVNPAFSLSVLTAIFPDEPGLAGFIEAEDDGSGNDNWSYKSCIAPVQLSSPTNQHPAFYRRPTNSVKTLKGYHCIDYSILTHAWIYTMWGDS